MIKITCKECGTKVRVDRLIAGIINSIHFLVVLYLGFLLFLYQDAKHLTLFIASWILFDVINIFFVPLKTVTNSNDS